MPIGRNIVAGVADSCRAQHIPTDADRSRQRGVRCCPARAKSPPSSREFSCATTTCRRLRRSASRWSCGHRLQGKSIFRFPSRAPWQFPPHASSQRNEKIDERGHYAPAWSCGTVTFSIPTQAHRCAQQKRSRSSFSGQMRTHRLLQQVSYSSRSSLRSSKYSASATTMSSDTAKP